MAQYVVGKVPSGARSMFDPEDVDSEKWRELATSARWPLAWVYRREARRVFDFERRMARSFDVSVFVTRDEADLFKKLAPEVATRVTFRTQGVDTDFFDPALVLERPYAEVARVLVFVGVMDYWPNVEAAGWFAREVFPRIRAAVRDAEFYIVGLNPSPEVRRLAEIEGVHVTGGVPDVRPYLQHAWAACLPLRTARGIQNKVLEAMAMEKPVIASPQALTGIDDAPGFSPLVADSAAGLVEAATGLLRGDPRREPAARAFVREHFNWDTNLRRFEALLARPAESRTHRERALIGQVA
jgi:sugar transferase (PEP-CTERM/EpsH1 system associated)